MQGSECPAFNKIKNQVCKAAEKYDPQPGREKRSLGNPEMPEELELADKDIETAHK